MALSVLDWVSITVLVALMIACTVGVFHPGIDDSSNQRWGMVLTFFGSMGEVNAIWKGTSPEVPFYLIVFGISIFMLATAYKMMKTRRLTWF